MTSATRAREHAAQVRKSHLAEQARTARRRRIGVVVVVLLVAALVGVVVQQSRLDTDGDGAIPVGAVESGGILVGDVDAPVLLQVYEDFQCPACARFELANGPQIRERIDAGTLRVEYHLLSFLGPESVRAANAAAAAAAAGEERFLDFHDALYADQPAESSGGYTSSDLIRTARDVGVTGTAFGNAVRDLRFEDWVAEVQDKSSKRGVSSTPTVFLDGEKVDGAQLEPATFGALLEEATAG